MQSRILLAVFALWTSTALFSCKKKADEPVYRNPTKSDMQGRWKQDYYLDPLAFQAPPEWEMIECRNDSFYMNVVIRPEQLTALDCYQSKWTQYAKGIYELQDDRINFKGIITDSNYIEKTTGCNQNGTYNARFAIKFKGPSFTMNILANDTIVQGTKFEINMRRSN